MKWEIHDEEYRFSMSGSDSVFTAEGYAYSGGAPHIHRAEDSMLGYRMHALTATEHDFKYIVGTSIRYSDRTQGYGASIEEASKQFLQDGKVRPPKAHIVSSLLRSAIRAKKSYREFTDVCPYATVIGETIYTKMADTYNKTYHPLIYPDSAIAYAEIRDNVIPQILDEAFESQTYDEFLEELTVLASQIPGSSRERVESRAAEFLEEASGGIFKFSEQSRRTFYWIQDFYSRHTEAINNLSALSAEKRRALIVNCYAEFCKTIDLDNEIGEDPQFISVRNAAKYFDYTFMTYVRLINKHGVDAAFVEYLNRVKRYEGVYALPDSPQKQFCVRLYALQTAIESLQDLEPNS